MIDDLVKKLSKGQHTVDFEGKNTNLEKIQERINDGFVFITFTGTQGGTELGINLDKNLTIFNDVDFKQGVGNLKITGTCELNGHKVQCVANIDLKTRKGEGSLTIISP